MTNLATNWPNHYNGWDYRARHAALATMANDNSDVIILQGPAMNTMPWPEPAETESWPEQGYSLFEARDLFDHLNTWILEHNAEIFEETTTARFDDGGACFEIYFVSQKASDAMFEHFGYDVPFRERHRMMTWLKANHIDEIAYLWAGPY